MLENESVSSICRFEDGLICLLNVLDINTPKIPLQYFPIGSFSLGTYSRTLAMCAELIADHPIDLFEAEDNVVLIEEIAIIPAYALAII